MLPFSLFLALKYLRPKRSFVSVVTLISVVGVLLGVAILLIVTSVMSGFDNMWREKILSFKPHLTVQSRYGALEGEEEVCRRLEALPGIVSAAPSIEVRVLLQGGGRTAAPVVLGLDPVRAPRMSQVSTNMQEGVFSVEDDAAVIGRDLARFLGVGVGSRLLAYSPRNVINPDELYLPQELTVAGVFDLGMRDFDASFVLTSIEAAQKLAGIERGCHSVYVMTKDPFRFGEYAAAVEAELGAEFDVRTWKEVDQLLFEALSHEKTMMFLLLLFITIVAIFCVTNTLIVITVQKTHEIGLLKALGFSSSQVMGAFVWHGCVQCLAGTLAGIGAGLVVLHNLKGIVAALGRLDIEVFPKDIYGLGEIPWSISGVEIAQIAGCVMAFCTLASVLPAWRAARMDPVEALRKE